MKRTAFASLFAAAIVLLAAFSTFAITVKVRSIPDDGQDDSAAIQQAINQVIKEGGGTVMFPSGVTDLNNPIGVVPETYKPVNVIFKSDGGGVVRVSVGPKSIAFYVGNLNRLQVEDMVFTGKNVPLGDPQFFDANFVFFAGWVSQIRMVNTSFIGIAVPGTGALINASSNLTIDNCQFDGDSAAYPDGAVINLDCCTLPGVNATIRNTTFTDFSQFNGEYASKTGNYSGSWIRAKQRFWGGSTENQSLSVEDTFFDEGAAIAVDAQKIGSLNLRALRFNVSPSDAGTGIRAENVTRMRVEDSFFGYSIRPRPFAIVNDSTAEMIGITRGNNVLCPQLNTGSTISWRLSDCH